MALSCSQHQREGTRNQLESLAMADQMYLCVPVSATMTHSHLPAALEDRLPERCWSLMQVLRLSYCSHWQGTPVCCS